MSRYRFLLRPRWLAFHVLCLALMVTTVNLGLWQWSRHDEKRTARALVEQRTEQSTRLLTDVLAPGDTGRDDALRFTPVTAIGTYDWDAEVLVRSRTLDGRTGYWVLTPLRVDATDAAIVVNRGWVPLEVPTERPLPLTRPPAGTVTVAGYLEPGQTRGSFGPRDPDTGVLPELARADLGRIAAQYPVALYPMLLQLGAQEPAQPDGFPVPVPLPSPDLGPHLGYAAQWAIFTLLVPVGWWIVVRQSVRRHEHTGTPGLGTPTAAP